MLIRLAVPLPSTQKRVGGILPGYDAIWNKNQPHTILPYLLPQGLDGILLYICSFSHAI